MTFENKVRAGSFAALTVAGAGAAAGLEAIDAWSFADSIAVAALEGAGIGAILGLFAVLVSLIPDIDKQ